MNIQKLVELAYLNGQANPSHNKKKREEFFKQVPALVAEHCEIEHELTGRVVKEVITVEDEQLWIFTDGSWFIQYIDRYNGEELKFVHGETDVFSVEILEKIKVLDKDKWIKDF